MPNTIDATNTNIFDQLLDIDEAANITKNALTGTQDGELFLEQHYSESMQFDDGTLKNSSYNNHQGFGLRSVIEDKSAYGHSSNLNIDAITRAANTAQAVKDGYNGHVDLDLNFNRTNQQLYTQDNPIAGLEFSKKVTLLTDIDHYIRKKEPLIKQVSTSLAGSWQQVRIIRPDGQYIDDIRPLVRLNISVVVEKNGRMETGSYGTGGRVCYDHFLDTAFWQEKSDEAVRQALVNLESIPTPAGQMPVVLGPGWPGILLHEAVGHGLEGDFNRKKSSAFSGLIGQQVASKGVTVIDDGTIADRRGSLNIDDEGTPTNKTVLIEDGILKGYMQDRMNARLMGVNPTGNGRRESYAYQPMPRMTNTYMLAGQHDPQEMIASVKNGIYAVNFGGGQVDITSGKFVFSMSEAYLIENGKVTTPVKGATLIGNGPDALTKISMIGNDMQLDPGIGTCGKAGQGVPVGVGQPTLLIEGLTVGGTA